MADSDMSEAEQLALLFKQGGIEVVTEAKDSFAHLTEEMKGTARAADQVQEATKAVDTTTQQAIEVLKSDSTVMEDLKQKIAELTAQQDALRDSFVAGLIPSASAFKEKFDALGDSIADKQGILERATGEGDGEAGKGGLKGMAGAAVKAEKAIGMLASGGGLGRLPGMLEGVTSALGLAGGAGLAAGGLILAFESIIPKVEAFIEKITGAAEAAKKAAEALKIYHAEVKKEEDAPTEDEEKAEKVVKELLKGKGAQELRQGIEQSLVQAGIGLTAEQKAGHYTDENGIVRKFAPEEMEQFGQRSREAAQARAGQLMLELRKGAPGAIAEVRGMSHVPESFRTRLGQTTPEAIEAAKKQADQGEADSQWADTTYANREGARKENVGIQDEFDKALKDKKKYDVKAKATGFKDQLSELKSQLSDLGLDLKEKTISPEEYKEKADVLVDAIAAAIQGLAQVPGESAKTAKRDIEAAHRLVRGTFDRGVDAVKRATDKAVKDAKSKADHDARLNTPVAREHLARTAEQNEEMGMAQDVQAARADAGDTMAAQMGPAELQQVVAAVGRNRMMNSTLGFTLAQQVDYYMSQLEAKMVADFTRGMGQHDRSAQNINPRGGH